jgi:PEP-CTERM motif
MKLKLKVLAAAALIAAGASTHAAVETGSGVNSGELVFVAYDPTTLLSYSFDTGLRYQDFLPTTTSSVTFSLDNFGSFLSQVGSANQAGIRWGVFGSDGTSPIGMLTTQNGTGGSNPAQSRIANINSGIGSFFAVHNPLGTHATQANGSAIYQADSATAGTDGGYGGRLLGPNNNFNSNLSFNATGALNESLNFVRFSSPTALTSTRTQFATTLGASTWSVNGNNLVFTAPVPEPSTYALMLAGLGALGFMARRRNQV